METVKAKKRVASKSKKADSEAPSTRSRQAKGLVVVESPAKAKTLKKYLGRNYDVKASVGHILDLPKSNLGVDLEHDFQPTYEMIKGKSKVVDELKKAALNADKIYLAADPDREGEAIAWHIIEVLKLTENQVHRVLFHEITKPAVLKAIENPVRMSRERYESQQARRVLDRLVGYKISPLLWTKVRRGLSAGRVQSVAVRMIVEREKEVLAFQPKAYWTIEALLETDGKTFPGRLVKVGDKKIERTDI
ncbi:type I DNA topoisomerase, partial [bacterium]|nr:type I DNA topoisomerase [bacterium]